MSNAENQPDSSAAIHASAIIIDTHADTPQRFLDEAWDFTSSPPGTGMISLESARRGNLAAEFFALWVEPTEYAGNFAHRALALADAVHEQVRRHPGQLQLCLSPDDILTARAQQKFAVLLGLEGGHAIENDLALLRTFHRLGVRYMTLTWANSNDWAGSSGDRGPGLTPFGADVIREMNGLGMMIDISHVSDQTFWDVVAASSAPIIASHSSARALTNVPRNLTDEQLRAIAASGGVVMVNFYPGFIDRRWRDAWEASRPERNLMHEVESAPCRAAGQPVPFQVANRVDQIFAQRIPRPPLHALIDHFDHIIRIAGIDHVGLGSDFDGIPALPQGIDSAADLPRITSALLARGHTAADIHKLLGGNLLRVFRAIQGAAEPSMPSRPTSSSNESKILRTHGPKE